MRHFLLLVNCTPVGMHPNTEKCPRIPFDGITEEHLVVDLIYNPQETRFMKEARKRGAVVMNGGDMLRLQGEKSWEIWAEKGL